MFFMLLPDKALHARAPPPARSHRPTPVLLPGRMTWPDLTAACRAPPGSAPPPPTHAPPWATCQATRLATQPPRCRSPAPC
jgi:hypothetical protein